MLKLSRHWEGFLKIPFTKEKLTVSMDGSIFNTSNQTLSTGEKNDIITVDFGNIVSPVRRSVLVSVVAKLVRVPITHWTLLDTTPIDGNYDNVSASNLVWKFPEGGLRVCDKSSFSYIPGFTRYSINKEGVVYSHYSRRNLTPYRDRMGYLMYSCVNDLGKRNIIGMHRLLALAFIDFPANVDKLDVNHIDGIKNNNTLENLEWNSRKENCLHAYSTGLRNDNIPISVLNSFDGSVREFYSVSECARVLKVNPETISLRAKTSGKKIYPPGLQFKETRDQTPWTVISDPLTALNRHGLPKDMVMIDTRSGDVLNFDTLTMCAEFLNINPCTLHWRLKNHPQVVINGFDVKYGFSYNKLNKSSPSRP